MKSKFKKALTVTMVTALLLTLVPAPQLSASNFSANASISASTTAVSPWTAMKAYAKNEIVSYGGLYYYCIQPHTSLPGWEPSAVPALWGIHKGEVVDPKPDVIPVASVELSKTSVSLEKGKISTLTATVNPSNATNKSVVWSTSNSSIATVANGTITAIKAGTAVIAVNASGKTATCTVTITESSVDPIAVTSVSLNKASVSLEKGKTNTLTATVNPSNATDTSVVWSTSNSSVATVANGTITAIKAGTAIITVNASGKTATCTITVTESSVDPNPGQNNLPGRVLTGYWQNFINGAGGMKLADCPKEYNLICVSFADATRTPGEIEFNLDPTLSKALGGYTVDEFKNDIKIAHGKGQKVILSIGGEVGNVIINSPAAAKAFADSAYKLMQEYGFDGVDIDLEHGINVPNLADSLRQLAAKAGPSFILAMAPQTMDVYRADATYIKLAKEVKDILTIMNTQYYNSGSMPGYDDKNYTQGTIGFLNAIATIQIEAGLRPDQIGLGLPATTQAAGGGYQSPANVVAAIDSLVYGTQAGGFTPPKAYNEFRGAMTWSINWDKTANYNFAKTVSAGLAALPPVAGSGSQNPDPIAVTSVSLNKASISLEKAKTNILTTTVNPSNATNKSVVWSTSNSSVATVANGTITAIKAGTAIITVNASGKTATCTVTVTEPSVAPIAVTSVSLNKASISLEKAKTDTLTATVNPSNATDKSVVWSTSNNSVATVTNGTITAIKAGTAIITVNASGKTATCTVTVTEPSVVVPPVDEKEPPYPFWQDYKNYAGANTMVYYQGKIYKNKWYADSGFKPTTGDPWVLVGNAEWTVTENEANYKKDENAASNSINKVLNDSEIQKLYGGINPDFSPTAALTRLNELIPEAYYNELFPYRFGSDAWKKSPSTKTFYSNPESLPDYYSYKNLQEAIKTLSNTIVKVEWYEGSEWCYRIVRLNKTTKEQKIVYCDPSFNEDWIVTSKKLCTSVVDYGSFLAEGDLNTRKRELAGFLANISHETGGGSIDGNISDNLTGLYFNEEVGFIGSSATGYVQSSGTAYLPVAGKSYHGRGPIQLSYNYNYGLCSDVLFGDSSILLNNPEKLTQDGVLGFMTGIWFWMTPQPPKPSCHQVITGTWEPNAGGVNAQYNKSFGLTIIIINNEAGQSENGVGAVARRSRYYRIFAEKMGANITGENVDTMGMTTFTAK